MPVTRSMTDRGVVALQSYAYSQPRARAPLVSRYHPYQRRTLHRTAVVPSLKNLINEWSSKNVEFQCLTFGVELEFIACYDPADYETKLLDAEGKLWTDDSRLAIREKYGILVRIHMMEILNQHGFPTNGYKEKDFSKWTVETDSSVSSIDSSNSSRDWHAVELKTPVLRINGASLELIRSVVKLLVSKFRLFTNEKCGLHVHVGHENREFFDFRTLKKFCFLITAFDRQLESLHHPSRVQNPNAKSTRFQFERGTSLAEKLSIINEMENMADIRQQFHEDEDREIDRYMAYNFLNYFQVLNGKSTPPTIEFRQHRGTLDPELITHWVTVVCSLLEHSHTRPEAEIRQLLDKSQADGSIATYTIIHLLEDLQLRKQAEFYAPRLHQHGPVDDFMAGVIPIFPFRPGHYDTHWEKTFAPRPPMEQEYHWCTPLVKNDWYGGSYEPTVE